MDFSNIAYNNRPTRALVNLSHLRNNYEIVSSLVDPDVTIMGVIKANGYGHGIVEVASALIESGVTYLGVAYLEEAIYLRKNNITIPILVMGAINTEQIQDFLQYDIEITTSSIEKSIAISEAAKAMNKTAQVHIKIDTGMERIGVHWYNAEKYIQQTYELPNVKVKGIFSHLAKAESDEVFTREQLSRFNKIISFLNNNNMVPPYIHIANSAGIINYKESHYTMVRPGIMLYGYNPNGYMPEVTFDTRRLKPVMTLLTKVSYFKVCPSDTGISYNHIYRTTEQTRVVTLPIGYGDGYYRLLSNKGEVAIRGEKYIISGTICMDQIMVDIGPKGTAYNGDDVLLFGEFDSMDISLDSLCDMIGTIPYEFLCNIGSRVPRIYKS